MNIGGNLDVWGGTGFHDGVDMNNTGIKNLADGTLSATSTDAVTGKQLNATNTRVTTVEGSVTTLQNTVNKISSSSTNLVQQSAAGKDITVAKDLDGGVVDFTGKNLSTSETFTRKLTGLADGALSASSTDAVTGKQLYTTNQNLAETNKNLSANTTNISNLQNTVNNISSGSAGLVQQSAAGKDITVAKDLDGGVVDFTGKNLSTSEAFTRKLTGLADGALSASSTDAVTGKQLYTTNQNLTETNKNLAETNKNLSANTTNISNLQNTVNNISSGSAGLVQQSAAGKDITVAKDLDGGVVDFSGKNLSTSEAFTRKLTGLADGALSENSTDAVTGKQLYTTNQNLTETNKNLSANTTNISNLQNTVNNISSGSAGLVQQSAAGKDITVAKDLDGGVVDFTGKNLSTSETFTRKLTGLADGALSASSTDAVTGKQLYTTNQNLAETNKNLSANTTNISNLQNTVNNISSGSAGLVQQSAAGKDITVAKDLDGGVVDFTGKNLSTSEAFTRKLTGLADGALSASSTDAVTGKQLYTTNQNLNATNTRVTTAEGSITNLQNTVNNISKGSTGLVQQSAAGKDITVAKDLDGGVVDFSGKNLSTSEAFTRKLTGLADGALSASSTDAVTGKQLYTTNQNLTETNQNLAETNKNLSANTTNISNLQNTVNNISSGSAGLVQQSAAGKDITVAKDLDGGVVDFSGKNLSTSEAFTRKLTGLADGALSASSTDAVTGKQLYTTNQNLTETNQNLAETNKNLSANTTNISNLQNTVNNISSGSAGLVQQSAAGKDITVAKDLDGGVVDFSGKNLSTSEAFTRKLTGLADGALSASSTDAVTGKQLYTTNQNLTETNQNLAETNKNLSANTTNISNLQNTVNNISKGSTGLVQQSAAGKDITVAKDLDGDVVDFSGKNLSTSETFTRKLTGLADGTLSATSTDAVTGKQLNTTNTRVTTAEGSIATLRNTMNTIVNGGGFKYLHANSTLDDAQATGLESIAIGGAAIASGVNAMAMGGNARAVAGNAVALGAGSVADRANTVSVGSAGQERQIANVAAGTADTDAVNVAQLKAAGIINGNGGTNAAVTYGTHADGSTDYRNVTLGGGNVAGGSAIHNVAAGTTDTDAVNVGQMHAAIASVQKGVASAGDPMFAADGDRALKKAIAKGTHATAMGAAASAGGNQSIATGHNAQSGGDSSVAMGANAKATADHAVAVGDGSVAHRANTVSVGSAGKERQVTNVASGTLGTDAVNLDQLNQTVFAAVGDLPAGTTAKQYTDGQISMVRQSLNQVARGAYSGVAAATALTMIPDVDQGKTIAVGIGSASYKGYQAVALGASARIAQHVKAKMGVGYSTEGTTVGLGASYQW
ncbi:YadA-like family protein [Ralstonia solanacearum]|uniref:YadA-like family protein n=2 Tax=Ralstonia solanacearum TaxID=305 RepID=UPI0018D075ED|nr:YadA-like family protein [Ralstonia solanacearum]